MLQNRQWYDWRRWVDGDDGNDGDDDGDDGDGDGDDDGDHIAARWYDCGRWGGCQLVITVIDTGDVIAIVEYVPHRSCAIFVE